MSADLRALLAEQASAHAVPGAALGILQHGEEATAYFGVADATTGEPVTYTNAGWCLVGRAIETATGLGWEDAVAAVVLGRSG